jgi:hypothetical protein
MGDEMTTLMDEKIYSDRSVAEIKRLRECLLKYGKKVMQQEASMLKVIARNREQRKQLAAKDIELANALSDLKHEKERVEVMHLRRENELRQMNELGTQNKDLMANCNQLRDRCWKAEQEVEQLEALKTGIMLTYEPIGPVTFNGVEYVPKEELARWWEIAIEERAKQMNGPCDFRTKYEWCDNLQASCDGFPRMWECCPNKDRWRSEAAKELQLKDDNGGRTSTTR